MINDATRQAGAQTSPPEAAPAPMIRDRRTLARWRKVLVRSILANVLFSIGLSMLTSWMFWKYILFLEPDIHVSPVILKGPSRNDDVTIYRIKLVNRGSRQMKDVSVVATIYQLSGKPGVDQRRVPVKRLTFRNNPLPLSMGPRDELDAPWGLSPMVILVLEDEIESLLRQHEGSRLVLTLTATDAQSGTTRIERHNYTLDQIKRGDFLRNLEFDYRPDTGTSGVDR